MRHWRAVVFLLLVITGMTACAPAPAEKNVNGTTDVSGLAIQEPEPITFDTQINYYWWIKTDWGSDLTSKEITRLTGVSLNITTPADQVEAVSNLNLMLSSGNYPDMIMMEDSIYAKKMIQKGAFRPLNELIDKYGTNIRQTVGMDFLKEYCAEENGNIYGLPNGIRHLEDFPESGSGMMILKSVYEKLGSPKLETVDDLYNYLRRVRDNYLTNSKGERILPSCYDWPSQDLAPVFGARFFTVNGGSYVYNEDHKLKQILWDPRMKEALRFTSKLYREKLIDQDWLVQDSQSTMDKLTSGRMAVFFSSNAFGWLEEFNSRVKSNSGDELMLVKLPRLPGVTKVESNLLYMKPWNRIYITKTCKNPLRAFQFLDWETSEKAQYITRIGPEGVVWNYDSGNKPRVTPEYEQKLKENRDAALSEIGYLKWCWQQNNTFLQNAVLAFKDEEEKKIQQERAAIILDTRWYAPELEHLDIDQDSENGMNSVKINIFFSKMDKQLYMAQSDEMFENLFRQAQNELRRLGIEQVEQELNKKIETNLAKLNK